MHKTILFIIISNALIYAQNGPGGIGNSNGANNQPEQVLWLLADAVEGISDGGSISTWADLSGKGNNAYQDTIQLRPVLKTNIVNQKPVIRFDGLNDNGGDYLIINDADNLDNTSGLSVFIVFNTNKLDTYPRSLVSKRDAYIKQHSYAQFFWNDKKLFNDIHDTDNRFTSTESFLENKWYVTSLVYDGTLPDSIRTTLFVDGKYDTVANEPSGNIPNFASNLNIGKLQNTYGIFTYSGDIAEVIIYRTSVNIAQRTILENHLSAKYNIPVDDDYYAGDDPENGNYDFSVIGIGQSQNGSHEVVRNSGLQIENELFLKDNGDFLIAGHNAGNNSLSTDYINTAVYINRWKREWYFDRTDGGISAKGNVRIKFDRSESGLNFSAFEDADLYRVLSRSSTTDPFTAIETIDATIDNDEITFIIAANKIVDGYYTLGKINQPPYVDNAINDFEADEDDDTIVLNLANVFNDVDDNPAQIIKSITGNSNTGLVSATINGNNLSLDLTANLSGEATISIQGNSNGQLANDSFVLTVNPVDDPPFVQNPIPDIVVDEDDNEETIVLSNVFSDIDSSPSQIEKSIVSITNPALIETNINGNALVIKFKMDQYGTTDVVIQGNSAGLTVNDTFNVHVHPVQDPLAVLNPIPDINVDEDDPNDKVPLDSVFLDVDDLETVIEKNLVNNSNPQLVDATIMNDTLVLDYQPDMYGNSNFIISGTAGSETVRDTFDVFVNPVDDEPTVLNPIADIEVNEDDANSTILLNNVFTDIDNNPQSIIKKIQNISNELLITATIHGDTLVLDYLPDQWGSTDVTIRGTSADLYVDDIFRVNVNPQNDPLLIISPLPDIETGEDASPSKIVLSNVFYDVDHDALEIAKIVWDNDNPELLNTEIKNDTLQINYLPDQFGKAQIVIRASSDNETVDDTITVTVLPLNDPPDIQELPVLAFPEDDSLKYNPWLFLDFISDKETPDSLLQVDFRTGNHTYFDIRQDFVTFKADSNFFGIDTLKIIVSDGQSSDSANLFINVTPLNDPPQFYNLADTITFDNKTTLNLAMTDIVRDVDLPDDFLTFNFTYDNDEFEIEFNDETDVLSISAMGIVGSANLSIKVSDDSPATILDTIMIIAIEQPAGIATDNGVPNEYKLFQNFPNPFNPYTKIKIALPKSSRIELTVYNVLGQNIYTIYSGYKEAGYHTFKFEAGNLPTGVYFYKIQGSNFHLMKKMILIK